jgi:hypothetical protein
LSTLKQIFLILSSLFIIGCESSKTVADNTHIENIIIKTSSDLNDKSWNKGYIKKEVDKIKIKVSSIDDEKALRIKVKNSYWKRLRTFSLKFKKGMNLLNEWVYHKMLLSEDVLSTRYEIARLTFNDKNKGLVAYEEYFEKQLIEYNHRREGPILKFKENATLGTAETDAYKMKKILEKPNLKRSYMAGKSLMKAYKLGTITASEIFDIDIMAKFMAITEINKAYNGLRWQNMRFYYNPIVQKLEPIGYNGFGNKSEDDEKGHIQILFNDKAFNSKYHYYLTKYSDSTYIESFLSEYASQVYTYKNEKGDMLYDSSYISRNAHEIRKSLAETKSPSQYGNDNTYTTSESELDRHRLLKDALNKTSAYQVKEKKITFSKGKHQTSNDIIIPSGYVVEFKAGHELNLKDSAKFISFSPVIMNGSKTEPIKIYSSDHTAKGFSVLLSGEESKLSFVNFKGLGTLDEGNWYLTGAVTFYKTRLNMQNCKIDSNHCEDALNTINSDIKIKNCIISNTYSDGFDSDFCIGTIERCTLTNTGNDALDFSGSKVRILSCKLDYIGDKGISCGEESSIEVDSIDISNAVWGVASKDLSTLDIRNSQISKCQVGMNAFVKKSEYGGASIKTENVKFIEVDTIKSKDKYSSIFFD